jgi:hypothetical protein
MISSIILDSTININSGTIYEILGVFVLMYIFKYGYNIQKESKGKIYSEE